MQGSDHMAGLPALPLPISKVLPRDVRTGQTHTQDPLTLSLLTAHLPERNTESWGTCRPNVKGDAWTAPNK